MHVIEDARRDIEIFAQNMTIKQIRAEKRQQPPSVHYNIHILVRIAGRYNKEAAGILKTSTGAKMKLSDEGYRALSILHGFLEGGTAKAVIAFKLASIVGIPTQQFIDAVNELDKTV